MSNDTLPSIRNRAVLMHLQFHKPPMTRLDRKATQDAERANNAKGVLRTQKLLYPKYLIDPIVAVEAEARGYLRRMGLEWGGSGAYLVDTRLYLQVQDELSKYGVKRKQEVAKFAQNWSRVLQEAAASQGDLFDASVYPDVSGVVSQFTMSVHVAPMGSMDSRLFTDIENELRERIEKDIDATTRENMGNAIMQPLERLLEAVLNLYDKTSRDNARIHDAVVEQVGEIADLMPHFNILELPQLDALANACKSRLQVSAELLRGKDNDRKKLVAEDAKRILGAVGIQDSELKGTSDQQSRKALAKTTAEDILARMDGFLVK